MTRSSPRPLIGVSACLKENGRGGWHHTVGEKYVQAAIRAVGGLPVLIPAIGPEFGDEPGFVEAMDRLLDSLDGVLLTGSPSNVEPHHYGKESREGTLHDSARDSTTLPLIRHTIDRGVPLVRDLPRPAGGQCRAGRLAAPACARGRGTARSSLAQVA